MKSREEEGTLFFVLNPACIIILCFQQSISDTMSWCGLECVLFYFVCLLSHFSCTLCVGNSSATEHATGVCVCGEGTARLVR